MVRFKREKGGVLNSRFACTTGVRANDETTKYRTILLLSTNHRTVDPLKFCDTIGQKKCTEMVKIKLLVCAHSTCGDVCAKGCGEIFRTVRAGAYGCVRAPSLVVRNLKKNLWKNVWVRGRAQKMVCGCVHRTLRFVCNVRAGAGQNRRRLTKF